MQLLFNIWLDNCLVLLFDGSSFLLLFDKRGKNKNFKPHCGVLFYPKKRFGQFGNRFLGFLHCKWITAKLFFHVIAYSLLVAQQVTTYKPELVAHVSQNVHVCFTVFSLCLFSELSLKPSWPTFHNRNAASLGGRSCIKSWFQKYLGSNWKSRLWRLYYLSSATQNNSWDSYIW